MLHIAIEDACSGDMVTLVRWYTHNLGVPLSRLARVDVYESTAEAIADWHYWVAQGHSLRELQEESPDLTRAC